MLGFWTVHAKTPEYLPEVRAAARQAFTEQYPEVSFAPIVVVIAAYNEEESLGQVLRAMPATVGGLEVDTVVVNDGSSDGTEKVALDDPKGTVAEGGGTVAGAALSPVLLRLALWITGAWSGS